MAGVRHLLDKRSVWHVAEDALGSMGFMDCLHPYSVLSTSRYDLGSAFDYPYCLANESTVDEGKPCPSKWMTSSRFVSLQKR